MTDNKALTWFFQSKRIPPKRSNFCEQTLQFDFVLAHVPGSENPAVDYLARLDIRLEERIHLKLNDEVPDNHVEIDLSFRTPKQDEVEGDYIPDDDTTTSKQHDAINAILDKVPKATTNRVNRFERDEKPSVIRSRRSSRSINDEMTFTRFISRHHNNVVSQVCTDGDYQIDQEQHEISDIQRVIIILSQNETSPDHANFESQFFQKQVKK